MPATKIYRNTCVVPRDDTIDRPFGKNQRSSDNGFFFFRCQKYCVFSVIAVQIHFILREVLLLRDYIRVRFNYIICSRQVSQSRSIFFLIKVLYYRT